MRRTGFFVSVIMAASSFPMGGWSQAAEKPSPAAELVQKALQSELAGSSAERRALLEQAMDADRNHAPAHWHAGQVRHEGRWLSLEQFARQANQDEKLADYRERRSAMIDTADAHRELADWCQR